MIRQFSDIDLSDRNSFHVAARAARLVEFDEAADLPEIFHEIQKESTTRGCDAEGSLGGWRWYVLSGGNNMLFAKDYEGTLIVPVAKEIKIVSEAEDKTTIDVSAGLEWDDLVEWAVKRGLWGIENLSAIPGKVGAAPVQNIGAYGVEVGDVIDSVTAYFPDSGFRTLTREECKFGYRDSIFKRERCVIVALRMTLSSVDAPRLGYGDVEAEVARRGGASLRHIRSAICDIRAAKLPDPQEIGNAGSFFKNPVVSAAEAEKLLTKFPDAPHYPAENGVKLAAGWLIDKAGLKGFSRGHVGVHPKQALVLVNLGGATGQEVIAFARIIQDKVYEKFGVRIVPEVNIL